MTRIAITKNNLSPLLEIFIWFCLVVSLVTVFIRLVTKRYMLHRVHLDDYLILVSLVWIPRRRGFDFDSADLRRVLHLLNQSLSQWRPRMVWANVSIPWMHTNYLHY